MKKPPVKGVNVDEAVACGAAIYAGLQNTSSLNSAQKKAISKVELNDVCNFYMGTIVAFDDHEKRQTVRVNDIIIERNTPLPASVTKDYQVKYDDQPTIRFSVTQSEGDENDIEFVVVIAEEVMDLSDYTQEEVTTFMESFTSKNMRDIEAFFNFKRRTFR